MKFERRNIAFGGNFGIFSLKNFTFSADGRFTTEKTGGASDTNMTVYSKKDSAGKHTLNGNMLTLKLTTAKHVNCFSAIWEKTKMFSTLPETITQSLNNQKKMRNKQ